MASDAITAYFQPVPEATWDELQLIAAEQLQLPTTYWTELSPERNIIRLNARIVEVLNVQCIERYRGMWLSFSEGEPLSILARERYATPRLEATYATCVGMFNNITLISYTIEAGDYVTVKKSSTPDVTYRIDGPFTITAGASGPFLARATTPGVAGSALAGDIDTIEGNSYPGVSFANTSAATARDQESDPELASRARLSNSTLSIAGPSDAYKYFARGGERAGQTDPTIAAIGVTRVEVVKSLIDGSLTGHYATASGGVSSPDVALINAKLALRVVPTGQDYLGLSAVAKVVDISYIAYVRSTENVSEEEVTDAIEADLIVLFQEIPIGGYPEIVATPGYTGSLSVSKIRGLIVDVLVSDREPVHNATNSLNLGGDVLFLASEVPVLGTITASVVFQ